MAKRPFAQSIRFRLAAVYTVVVMAIGALVVGALNVAFSRSLDTNPVTAELLQGRVSAEPGAALFVDAEALDAIEALANKAALDELRSMSLIALVVLFPASLLAGWFIAGRALRPVDEIADVAREIQASDLSRRIRLEGPDDELKHLADTFDEMLERIEDGVEDQRKFIQDVSHELRNPLATMATSLDVVLSQGDVDPEELRRAGTVLRRSIDRTSRTVDGLTRFARRELPTEHQAEIKLGSLARDILEELRVAAEKRSIQLKHVGDSGPAVEADRQALRSAVGNLAGNAIRLAPEGSTVICGAGKLDGWAWVGVRDEGPGIEANDHWLVFQRSWGKDQSKMHQERRSGLGLSIVRQVAEAGGGAVTLTSAPERGSSFVIWLPTRPGVDPADLSFDGIHPVQDPLVAVSD